MAIRGRRGLWRCSEDAWRFDGGAHIDFLCERERDAILFIRSSPTSRSLSMSLIIIILIIILHVCKPLTQDSVEVILESQCPLGSSLTAPGQLMP